MSGSDSLIEALKCLPIDTEVTLYLTGGQVVTGRITDWDWETGPVVLCVETGARKPQLDWFQFRFDAIIGFRVPDWLNVRKEAK